MTDSPRAQPVLQVVAGQAGPEELAAVTAVVAVVLAARQRHAAAAAAAGRGPAPRSPAARLGRPGRVAACPAEARPRRLAPRRPPPLTRQPDSGWALTSDSRSAIRSDSRQHHRPAWD